ncbi:MAG TPA: TOPRIM nucleotidyl transferase/hydrolase domain-containing protein [Jatrophihabitans sp.]|uniref:TOPRIM nucleotidyl transferase/hydrolase domain-containing protein n=1 Tax=Jatrophihabitans sp. TaxID=1932789 RepID=UPI002F189CCD
MRISHLRLANFRGWAELDLTPGTHVLLAGVPRAGRSDILIALTRLLDPAYNRVQPSEADVRRQPPPSSGGTMASLSCASAPMYGEVEVTLVGLDPELEQLCEGALELLDSTDQIDESGDAAPDAALGVRLAYRVTYDSAADLLEHVVFYPARSNPAAGQFARVPAAVRRALPVVGLNAKRPLQLRAEGQLRQLVVARDPDAAADAFRALEDAVAVAADALSTAPVIAETVDEVLGIGGVAEHVADGPLTSDDVRFRAEDGSLSALLRAVQPSLKLDNAGLISLSEHGSTTSAVMAAAEALLLASSTSGAIVLGDDFGDVLDGATAEHLAMKIRSQAAQAWVTTRRPEVARAFAPAELVRLSRGPSGRTYHQIPEPSDKKEVAVRRLLHAQLLPALTATTVVIVEGPHDLTTYMAADRHTSALGVPLSAAGIRLISADNGSGGGTSQIPRVAKLAKSMGFRVVALIDHDPTKTSAGALAEIVTACDATVRLPTGTAVERALTTGFDLATLRLAAQALAAYGSDPADGVHDAEVATKIVQFLHNRAFHEQFLDALVEASGSVPPVIAAALKMVSVAADLGYSGVKLIDLAPPPAPAVASPTSVS